MNRRAQPDQFRVRRRSGYTLVEVIITGVLLGGVFLVVVPSLSLVGRTQRDAERRRQARTSLENAMERFTSQSWDFLTQSEADRLQAPEPATAQLPQALLECTVTEEPGPPAARRIHMELSWVDNAGRRIAPVRLTSWVYRQKERTP